MVKKILFSLYCFLMIGGIVLLLIFAPDLSNDTDLNINQPNKEQSNNNENNNIYYGTKIKLNCEDELVISVGSTVELISGFITVEPSICFANITTSLSKVSGAVNGLSYANNIISAHAVGKYEIMFSIPKTSTEYINDKLYIQVVEKEDDNKVKLINNSFTNNTTISLNKMLEINETYQNYQILNNEHFTYSNKQISFTSVGNESFNFVINELYLRYKYNFNISINPLSTSGVYVSNVNNGVLEISGETGCYFDIYYIIILNSVEHSSQEIMVSIDDSSVILIKKDFILAPIITCKILNKGSVQLTITPKDDLISPKVITIIIK